MISSVADRDLHELQASSLINGPQKPWKIALWQLSTEPRAAVSIDLVVVRMILLAYECYLI